MISVCVSRCVCILFKDFRLQCNTCWSSHKQQVPFLSLTHSLSHSITLQYWLPDAQPTSMCYVTQRSPLGSLWGHIQTSQASQVAFFFLLKGALHSQQSNGSFNSELWVKVDLISWAKSLAAWLHYTHRANKVGRLDFWS